MMKYFILFFFTLITFTSFGSKSFHFPDVDYAYAKIYYFNIGEPTSRPDAYIYSKEDGYAKSIVSEGKLSTRALTSNIEKLFLYHKNGLLNGLSGCYIPRHGIIYFDKNDKPVASLSICFECQAIRMWTKEKGKIKSTNPKETNGEGQINTLKQFILKEDIIVSDNLKEYDKVKKEKVTITMTYDNLDSNIVAATYNQILNWSTIDFKKDTAIKYTGGVEKYEFASLNMDLNTNFLFYDVSPNSKLAEAYIDNPNIILPNGIHCGNSLDELMETFIVYDGPSNPSVFILEDGINKIVYTFENQILVSITINK